jgi:hypothetical protein
MLNHRLGVLAKIASGTLFAALLLVVAGLSTPAQAAPRTHFVAVHETAAPLQTGTSTIVLAHCTVPLQATISFTSVGHIGNWLAPITPNCGAVNAPLPSHANPTPINWLLTPGITR